jgi:hypothetical protein
MTGTHLALVEIDLIRPAPSANYRDFFLFSFAHPWRLRAFAVRLIPA